MLRASHPPATASAFFFLGFLLFFFRIYRIIDENIFLIFIRDNLQLYKILYYVIGIIIGGIFSFYFYRKEKYQEIAEKYENVDKKIKIITDILLIVYYFGVFVSLLFI